METAIMSLTSVYLCSIYTNRRFYAGAISGDVLGSVYEAQSTKDKGFRLFHELGRPTDDSILSLAVARAIMDANDAPSLEDYARSLRAFAGRYPNAGFGGSFRCWLAIEDSGPYGSWGNGSAMRASAVGWAFDSEDEVLCQAALSASPTHDHVEGIQGAQAVALAVCLARKGESKEAIRSAITGHFGYDLNRSVDAIRPAYSFEISCRASVPEAIIAFLDSSGFEDALRNAISLGGDADTQACIAGAIAEAFYGGVPPLVLSWVLPRLDDFLLSTLLEFARRYLPRAQQHSLEAETESRLLEKKQNMVRGETLRSRGYAPDYRILLSAETWKSIGEYSDRLAHDPSIAGSRLASTLARLPIPRANAAWLLSALIDTKAPRIFAGSDVIGDGSDWTAEELGMLGDIGIAVPVTVFDDGNHESPRVHAQAFSATLLFIPGAILRSSQGKPADWQVVQEGQIDPIRFEALYERRLLPLLRYASSISMAAKRYAFITIPGIGCGQFAGRFKGSLGTGLRNALISILRRHAGSLPGIRAIWFDPYDECEDARYEFSQISFFVRPLARSAAGKPQLCTPCSYAEAADDFSSCDLYSMVAWDHVSWPGNDFHANARLTDDGVKAAATDSMFAITGFRGTYDPDMHAYLPPEGAGTWEDIVLGQELHLTAIGNTIVSGPIIDRQAIRVL